MEDEKLIGLLRESDAALGELGAVEGLAGRVLRRAARQRKTRRGMTGVAAAIVAGVAALWVNSGEQAVQVAEQGGATENRQVVKVAGGQGAGVADERVIRTAAGHEAEIARLEAEIEVRLAVIAKLRAGEAERAKWAELRRRRRAAGDAMAKVRGEVEKAALITVYQADRKYNELGLKESAIADYRRAAELFGETRYGKIAAERLRDLELQI